jgi:hypothetical protein
MPRAVWSQNTTICGATSFTPFRLLFGAKAILPKEIKHQSLRTTAEVSPCPSEAEEKDLLDSDMLKMVANLQKYQDETRFCRDPKVRKREFDVANLVLLQSPNMESSGKLESKWDGPYVVIKKTRLGAYHLVNPQGPKLEHSWNVDNLRHFNV